jgi:hypothetical protein
MVGRKTSLGVGFIQDIIDGPPLSEAVESAEVIAFYLVLVFDLDLRELPGRRAHCRIVTHHPGRLEFGRRPVTSAPVELLQCLYSFLFLRHFFWSLYFPICRLRTDVGSGVHWWYSEISRGDNRLLLAGNEENSPSNGNPHVIIRGIGAGEATAEES